MTDPNPRSPDGVPPVHSPSPAPDHQTSSLAMISLVAGLCGLSVAPLIGSIVAVITGHLALRQIRQTGQSGSGLAKIGLGLGYLGIALVVLGAAAFLAFVVVRSSGH